LTRDLAGLVKGSVSRSEFLRILCILE
jgi:hypothetical protein